MERIKLDLVPSCIKPVLHASQYDDGRQWQCDILNGGTPYVFQSGDTVDYTIRKGDGLLVTGAVAVTPGTSYITLVCTEQMCAVFGSNLGELTITSNGSKVGSVNFIVEVERAPDEGGLTSQSEINNLNAQINEHIDEVLPEMVEGITEPIVERLVPEVVGDNYYNKSQTYSQTEVNEKLTDYGKVYDSKYILLSPEVTINNCRAIWSRNNDKAYMSADSNQTAKAYPVRAGEKYIIRSFGYDRENFDVAVIGEALVGVNSGTPLLQVILCGGSTYPTDYKNHVIEFTVEHDGYLYINQRNSSGVTSYAKKNEVVSVRNENCLIINNGNYKHLAYVGNGLFVLREFTRRGPNNLFQLVHVGIGHIVKGIGFVESKSYMTASTDIVGPFSIDKVGWGGGAWTGGNHSVTVGGVACPTAEQLSLSVVVDNEEVTENGIYYGDVRIVANNKLYFAQTITGNTFTGATAAILETRTYHLTDTMNVEVFIEMLDDVRVAKYYGMQYVNSGVERVVVPSDEVIVTIADLSSNYNMTNKQPNIILQYPDGEELHMILRPSGLGSYAHNNGSENYGLVATYGKTYHTLISSETIATGSKLYWSGEYKMIV